MEKSSFYLKSYGAWAGNPEGHAPNFTRCCAEIYSRERFSQFYQCTKPRGHGPDGAYCKQHDPVVAKARKDASDARGKDRWNKLRYEIHGRTFFNALLKISEGHNSPRELAMKVIAEFKEGES